MINYYLCCAQVQDTFFLNYSLLKIKHYDRNDKHTFPVRDDAGTGSSSN